MGLCCGVAQNGLTKSERKLVARGGAEVRSRLKSAARSQRLMGTTTALAAAKLDASMGDMSPTVTIPVVGDQKVSTIAGALFLAHYAMSRNPSAGASALGYAGLALVCRSF